MKITIGAYREFLKTNILFYYKDNPKFRDLHLLKLSENITLEQLTDEMLIDFIKEDVGWYNEPDKPYAQTYEFSDGRKFSASLVYSRNSRATAKEQTNVTKL